MILRFLSSALLCAALTTPVHAERLANKLFGAMDMPSGQKPMPIGSYARGCAAGLVELPQPRGLQHSYLRARLGPAESVQ